jgi:ubiquinone/menaquinone biosynthesis C-methylase UbiE
MINGVYEQLGFRAQQASGIGMCVATSGMTSKEKGIEELERVRQEQGFRASIGFRDAPFER